MCYSFRVTLFSCCTLFMLHSFHVASFSVLHCFHVVLFVDSFHVALFPFYTFFILNSFHVALFHVVLFLCCFFLCVALLSCCTFFRVASCCTLFMLQFLGIQVSNFIKKRLHYSCFSVKFVKFLRTPILENICEQLLQKKFLINSLNVKVSQYSHITENKLESNHHENKQKLTSHPQSVKW